KRPERHDVGRKSGGVAGVGTRLALKTSDPTHREARVGCSWRDRTVSPNGSGGTPVRGAILGWLSEVSPPSRPSAIPGSPNHEHPIPLPCRTPSPMPLPEPPWATRSPAGG